MTSDLSMTWEQFLSVTVQEPDGAFIADGDTLFETEADLHAFYDANIAAGQGVTSTAQELAGMTSNGKDVKWSDSQKLNLTYCVSTKFGSHYGAVVQAMKDASAAWQATANIRYVYVSSQDSNCTKNNSSLVFDVNPVNVNGQYLARSFFPNSTRKNREVLIDNSAFGKFQDNPDTTANEANITLTGVLRHELGHTIGFRHEHTRPEAAACFEDNNWRALTSYDPYSVMHYPQCNGKGDWSLTLTTLDKQGALKLYPR